MDTESFGVMQVREKFITSLESARSDIKKAVKESIANIECAYEEARANIECAYEEARNTTVAAMNQNIAGAYDEFSEAYRNMVQLGSDTRLDIGHCYSIADRALVDPPSNYAGKVVKQIIFEANTVRCQIFPSYTEPTDGSDDLITHVQDGLLIERRNRKMIEIWYDDYNNIYIAALKLLIMRNHLPFPMPAIYEAHSKVRISKYRNYNSHNEKNAEQYKQIKKFIDYLNASQISAMTCEDFGNIIEFSKASELDSSAELYTRLFDGFAPKSLPDAKPTEPSPVDGLADEAVKLIGELSEKIKISHADAEELRKELKLAIDARADAESKLAAAKLKNGDLEYNLTYCRKLIDESDQHENFYQAAARGSASQIDDLRKTIAERDLELENCRKKLAERENAISNILTDFRRP